MAEVRPFPLARRHALIGKQARRMMQLLPDAAERDLQRALKVQRDALDRKNVESDVIAREVRGMEAAIRGELWHLILTPGNSSGR